MSKDILEIEHELIIQKMTQIISLINPNKTEVTLNFKTSRIDTSGIQLLISLKKDNFEIRITEDVKKTLIEMGIEEVL